MKKISLAVVSLALVATPFLAYARDGAIAQGTSPSATERTDTGVTRANFEAKAKERAFEEIDRRIKRLTEVSTRIGEMKKVSPADKKTLQDTIAAQITALTALRAKIEATTDLDTLKADIKSIRESYRIYALLLPQIHIIAAADRAVTIVGEMSALEARLALRIASTTGDTTALVAADTALKAKLVSVQTLVQDAVNLVIVLQPDNGDQAVAKSNRTALQNAQAKIREASKTLKAAREDIRTILKMLVGNSGLRKGEDTRGASSTAPNN